MVSTEDEKFIQTTSEFVGENEISYACFFFQHIHAVISYVECGLCSFSVGMANYNLKISEHTVEVRNGIRFYPVRCDILTFELFFLSYHTRACVGV